MYQLELLMALVLVEVEVLLMEMIICGDAFIIVLSGLKIMEITFG
jgi:hypothetical protein